MGALVFSWPTSLQMVIKMCMCQWYMWCRRSESEWCRHFLQWWVAFMIFRCMYAKAAARDKQIALVLNVVCVDHEREIFMMQEKTHMSTSTEISSLPISWETMHCVLPLLTLVWHGVSKSALVFPGRHRTGWWCSCQSKIMRHFLWHHGGEFMRVEISWSSPCVRMIIVYHVHYMTLLTCHECACSSEIVKGVEAGEQ